MLATMQRRIMLYRFPKDMPVSTIYRHAILVLLLIIDEKDGDVIWGDACEGMEAALAQLKAVQFARAA
ncbi:MAG TPA: hypothetical protein VH913_15840 [Hyphomicrobiaceae bacterium]|jgi:hypothetical protein